MAISMSENAIDWVLRELHRSQTEGIRFVVRYGDSQIHPGFSFAMAVAAPLDPAIHWVQQGITFFVEHGDLWYIEGYDLHVHYDSTLDDLTFSFTPAIPLPSESLNKNR